MPDLLMIVPSRAHPDRIGGLVTAWDQTTCGHADLLIVTYTDDPDLEGYAAHRLTPVDEPSPQEFDAIRWTVETPGTTLDAIGARYLDRYQAIGHMRDDQRPVTGGWDALLMACLNRPGGEVVYPVDQDGHIAAAAINTRIINRGGRLLADGTHGWTLLIQSALSKKILPDVVFHTPAYVPGGRVTAGDTTRGCEVTRG